MNNNEKNIPEIVGLTKVQFFTFIISIIITTIGSLGCGYWINSNYNKKEKIKQEENQKTKIQIENAQKSLGKTAQLIKQNQELFGLQNVLPRNFDINSSVNENSKQFFIIIGITKNEQKSKRLQHNLDNLGITIFTEKKNMHYVSFIGPFTSFDQARNQEMILRNNNITGIITNDL